MLSVLLATLLAASPTSSASPAPPPTPAEIVKPLNLLLVRGKYAQALAAAEALARRAQREGNVSLQARALLVESDALYYLNRQPETKPIMERALSLYQSIGDQEGIGRAYYNLSFLYERTDPERMVRLLETAQPYAARSGDPRLQMFVQNGLGNAKYALSRATDALVHYRESVRFARELKDDHSLAVALSNIGLMEQHRARYAEAQAALEEAGALHEKFGPSLQAGQVLINLGLVWRSRGEPEKAMDFYERGLAVFEKFGYQRYITGPLVELAELHAEQGDREQAEAMRRRALRIAEDADDPIRTVELLCLLARDADAQGRGREADELLLDAARRARTHGDPGLRIDVALTRSRLDLRRGDAAAALAAADDAAALAQKGDDPQAEGGADDQRAEALAALGRPAEAAAAWEHAISRYEGTGTSRHLHLWPGRLAAMEAALGHDDRARFHYEESLRRTRDLERVLAIDRFRLSLFDEVAGVHREYACWLAARGEAVRAWEVLEQGRTRELRLRIARAGGGPEPTPEEREALARLSLLQRRLREETLDREERRSLARTIAEAEDQYEDVRRHAQRGRAPLADEVAALPAFPPGMAVVEYALAGSRLLVLSHRDGATRSRVADAPALADRVGALRAAASDASRPFASQAAARELGELLLGPEVRDLAGGRLVIVPDDVLHTLPFAVLMTSDGASWPIGSCCRSRRRSRPGTSSDRGRPNPRPARWR
jgi:tetratricopeptide (TPR) repeat protein